MFQAQPEVGHVYLGSKRHVLERIFNDKNEPFWRSAMVEIGPITPAKFAPFLRERFVSTGKAGIDDAAVDQLLGATGGHPYATQELAYAAWGSNARRRLGRAGRGRALGARQGARAKDNHFAQLWDEAPRSQRLTLLALADDPVSAVYSAIYHRHHLPANPTPPADRAQDPAHEGARRPR